MKRLQLYQNSVLFPLSTKVLIHGLVFITLCLSSLFLLQGTLFAATVVLTNGAAFQGKLVERTERYIKIQNYRTKRIRTIRTAAIKSLILDAEDRKMEKKKADKRKKEIRDARGLTRKIQPMIGIAPLFGYPIGELSSGLSFGYGGGLFCSLRMPLPSKSQKAHKFEMRIGLSAGFALYKTKSSDYTEDIKMIPVQVYTRLLYQFDTGLRPYIRIGGGITPVMARSAFDLDPTVSAALGLGFIPRKLPLLEFFLDAGMMIAFESIKGMFLQASFGVAYRFGAPGPKTSEKLR